MFCFYAEKFAIVDVNFGRGRRRPTENRKLLSISVDSANLKKRFRLKLKPNEHIIDPHFIALARKSNHSLLMMDDLSKFGCYYRSNDSKLAALDLCEGTLVR